VVAPGGAEWAPRPRVDNAMVKALARAFRWRKMLDAGVYATIEDLAQAKGIGKTYVSQVLRLTLLAPEIVEAILEGRQPADVQLDDLLAGFPLVWQGLVHERLTHSFQMVKRHGGDAPAAKLALNCRLARLIWSRRCLADLA
jgi:hypothetical protein